MSANAIIKLLDLHPLDEGGYFHQTFESADVVECNEREGISRPLANTIYYMLTFDSPLGILHRNKSDIIHCYHLGGSLEYLLISPEGTVELKTLGPDINNGQILKMVVPGGYWKATRLVDGEFALLSEIVVPGFDFRDRDVASLSMINKSYPQLVDMLKPFIQNENDHSGVNYFE